MLNLVGEAVPALALSRLIEAVIQGSLASNHNVMA